MSIGATAALTGVVVFAEPLVKHAVERSLDGDGPWNGDVGGVDVNLVAGTLILRDLTMTAQRDPMVLREVDAPLVVLALTGFSLPTTLHVDVSTPGLSVTASPTPPREGAPPVHALGFPLFEADLAVVGGTWNWVDGDFQHTITGVSGTFTQFGSTPGNSHLDLRGHLPAGHPVRVDGWLDVLTHQGDALDLHIVAPHLTVDDLAGADQHYVGVDLTSGVFALDLGVTVDPYIRSLPIQARYHAGIVDDLQAGALRGYLRASDVTVDDFELGPAGVEQAEILFQGSMAADGTRRGDVRADGVKLPIRRSLFASTPTKTTPADLLALVGDVEPSSIHVHRFQPIWIDDVLSPSVTIEGPEVFLDLQNLQTIDPDTPATVRLRGDIAGGQLDVDGTLDLTRWPMPSHIEADLRHLDVPRTLESLEAYTALTAREGRLEGAGRLDVAPDGTVTADLQLDSHAVVVEAADWEIRTGDVHLDVFGGHGSVTNVELSPLTKATLIEHAIAPNTTLSWDVERYLDSQVLWATATVDSPTVRALRPTSVPSGERPASPFPFSLDLRVTNGTVGWTDPTNAQVLDLKDVTLDVDRLGTASSRAHWVVDAQLERGAHLSGTAELDAFAGPGRTEEPVVHATLTGLDLVRYDDLSRAYLGFGGLTGQAGAELTMNATQTELVVSGADLALSSPIGALTAKNTRATVVVGETGVPSISGSASDVDGALDLLAILASSNGTTSLPTLPNLHIPWFDLRRGRLDLVHPVQTATLEDIDIRIRELSLGKAGEHGTLWTGATLADGSLVAAIDLNHDVHRASLKLDSILLADLNGLLLETGGFDVSEGRASGLVDATVHPFDGLHADIRLRLTDLDVYSSSDFRRGFMPGMRDLAVGTALSLTRRRGLTVLDLSLDADEKGVRIDPVAAVLQSVGRRMGLRVPLNPMIHTVALDAPPQIPLADGAALSSIGMLSATNAPR